MNFNCVFKTVFKCTLCNHFPVGTGKSVTGAHLAYSLIKSNSNGHHSSPPDGKIRCVMYCGPSNKSLDTVLGKYIRDL